VYFLFRFIFRTLVLRLLILISKI